MSLFQIGSDVGSMFASIGNSIDDAAKEMQKRAEELQREAQKAEQAAERTMHAAQDRCEQLYRDSGARAFVDKQSKALDHNLDLAAKKIDWAESQITAAGQSIDKRWIEPALDWAAKGCDWAYAQGVDFSNDASNDWNQLAGGYQSGYASTRTPSV